MTHQKCSHENCQQQAITTLETNGEEIPSCQEHLQTLLPDIDNEETGDRPILSNGEDEAAWINTDKNGNAYLSVKIEDGNYLNLFPQTSLIKDALNRQHQVNQQ